MDVTEKNKVLKKSSPVSTTRQKFPVVSVVLRLLVSLVMNLVGNGQLYTVNTTGERNGG